MKLPDFLHGHAKSEHMQFAIIDAPYNGARCPTLFVFGLDCEIVYRMGHKFKSQVDALNAAQAIEDAVCDLPKKNRNEVKRYGPSHKLQNQAVKEFE